ncbi:histidine phosphatase family protein, partial [Staphylococcus capitis]|uniref:histidine phosphatase family protein n=1 Tax=Staphylococcus capitis TaxID=29388 RepID=UPI0037D28789
MLERGIKSARELSAYFKNKYIDTVYVSDLKRTRQTSSLFFPSKTPNERSL